jgi:hypothetical protein
MTNNKKQKTLSFFFSPAAVGKAPSSPISQSPISQSPLATKPTETLGVKKRRIIESDDEDDSSKAGEPLTADPSVGYSKTIVEAAKDVLQVTVDEADKENSVSPPGDLSKDSPKDSPKESKVDATPKEKELKKKSTRKEVRLMPGLLQLVHALNHRTSEGPCYLGQKRVT